IRGSFHVSVAYPAATAPALRSFARRLSCGSVRTGGRPTRSALRRPRKPSCSSSRLQRITDCRDDLTHRATSAGRTPWRSSSAASRRRRSSSFSVVRSRLVPMLYPYPTTRDTGPASLIKSVIHLRHCHPFLEVSFIYGTFNENADFAFRYRKVACGVTTVFVENQNNPRGLSISLRNQHHAQFDRTQGSLGRGGGGGAAAVSRRVERSDRRRHVRTRCDGSCG